MSEELAKKCEEELWPSYINEGNRDEGSLLRIIEEAASVRQLLQERNTPKRIIVKAIVPGIWAQAHLFLEYLQAWDRAPIVQEIERFITDIEELKKSDLQLEPQARLLYLQSILSNAIGKKEEGRRYALECRKICESNSILADRLAGLRLKMENKLKVSSISTRMNAFNLYGNLEDALTGLNRETEVVTQKYIEAMTDARVQKARKQRAYEDLMSFSEN